MIFDLLALKQIFFIQFYLILNDFNAYEGSIELIY